MSSFDILFDLAQAQSQNRRQGLSQSVTLNQVSIHTTHIYTISMAHMKLELACKLLVKSPKKIQRERNFQKFQFGFFLQLGYILELFGWSHFSAYVGPFLDIMIYVKIDLLLFGPTAIFHMFAIVIPKEGSLTPKIRKIHIVVKTLLCKIFFLTK